MRASGDLNARLMEGLRILHLPAFRECFEREAERATREGLSFEQYLLELVEREVEARRQTRVTRLLRESKLPLENQKSGYTATRRSGSA